MAAREFNHPSVIFRSVENELPASWCRICGGHPPSSTFRIDPFIGFACAFIITPLAPSVITAAGPDPAPEVFGYHEVFHTFVCAAVGCHYLAIAIFVA